MEKNCQIEFPTKHVSEPSSDNKHNVGKNFSDMTENNKKKGTSTFCVNSISSHMFSKKNLKNSHDNNCI